MKTYTIIVMDKETFDNGGNYPVYNGVIHHYMDSFSLKIICEDEEYMIPINNVLRVHKKETDDMW